MSNPLKQYILKPVGEIPSQLKPYVIVPCPDGGFLVQYKDGGVVSRYDAHYNLLWQKKIGVLPERFSRFELTVSPDGRFIGMHAQNVVHILDEAGNLLFSQEHEPWSYHQSSDCYFAPADNEGKKYIWFFVPEKGGGYLQVLDGVDFSLVDSLWQEDVDYHYTFCATPDSSKVFIELAAGQDGSRLLEAQVINGEIVLKEYDQCRDLAMGDFSPSGREIVFAPDSEEGAMIIFSFPDMEEAAELDQEELFEGRDEFSGAHMDRVDYRAYFLSDIIIMVKTRFGRLLLIDRHSLECIGEIIPEGCNISAFDLRGQPVSDPAVIFDYASEMFDLRLTGKGQLIIIHTSNAIKVYDLAIDI